jgi:hypothetical protein
MKAMVIEAGEVQAKIRKEMWALGEVCLCELADVGGGGDLNLTDDHTWWERILCWMRLRGIEDGYPANARRIQKCVDATTKASKEPAYAFL